MTKQEQLFLTVKDEEGILRPLAGLWPNTEFGSMQSDNWLKQNPECSIVLVKITQDILCKECEFRSQFKKHANEVEKSLTGFNPEEPHYEI